MKFGIMTFHMAHNYGAMLQAFALREKVSEFGVECEVIDYRLPEIYNWHKKDGFKKLRKDNGIVIGSAKFFKRVATRYYTKDKRWCAFNSFMEKKIGISKNTYDDVSQLEYLDYNGYICGSDQIWNAEHAGGLYSGYFLDFTKRKDIKRIAYAASKGPTEINQKEKNEFYKLLSKFDAIGVREKGLKDSLEKIGVRGVEWVLDPTLLLSANKWVEIAKVRSYKKYVLIYRIKEDNKVYECARNIAKENNLIILEITYKKNDNIKDVIQLEDCGPEEFLGLFSKAEFIITNSFHGTCFSIIFNKNFYAIPYDGLSSRMDSLLNLLKLDYRKVYDLKDVSNNDIDYKEVNVLLEEQRDKSIDFLKRNIIN